MLACVCTLRKEQCSVCVCGELQLVSLGKSKEDELWKHGSQSLPLDGNSRLVLKYPVSDSWFIWWTNPCLELKKQKKQNRVPNSVVAQNNKINAKHPVWLLQVLPNLLQFHRRHFYLFFQCSFFRKKRKTIKVL